MWGKKSFPLGSCFAAVTGQSLFPSQSSTGELRRRNTLDCCGVDPFGNAVKVNGLCFSLQARSLPAYFHVFTVNVITFVCIVSKLALAKSGRICILTQTLSNLQVAPS